MIDSGDGSPAPLADTLAPLMVGASSRGTFPFTGHLDEIAIYGRVLDPDTIADHHAVGRATR